MDVKTNFQLKNNVENEGKCNHLITGSCLVKTDVITLQNNKKMLKTYSFIRLNTSKAARKELQQL